MSSARLLEWPITHWRAVIGGIIVLFSLMDAVKGWLWDVDWIFYWYGGLDRLGQGDERKWVPPPWALFYLLGNLTICWGLSYAGHLKREAIEEGLDDEDPYPPGTVAATPFYPRFVMREIVVAIGVVGVIVMLSSLLNPAQFFEPSLDEDALFTIEAPADPFETPPGILPEWYFITSFFMLQIMPPWLALVGVMGLFVMGLILVPFLDNHKQKHPLLRPIVTMSGYMVVSIWIILTLIGEKVLEWRPWEWSV